MRDFSKISPNVWDSDRFINLASDDARYLYLFLLSSKHQTSAGVFQLKDAYAVADLRWTLERYLAARSLLIDADLIRQDSATHSILIRRWFKHNGPMNDSHFKGVTKVIERIECEAFQREALECLVDAYQALKDAKAPQQPAAPGVLPVPNGVVTISPAMRDLMGRKGWGEDFRGAA